MKKITAATFILFLAVVTNAQVKFDYVDNETKYATVVKKAEEAGKLIFIDFTAEWCGWCKHMDKTTFQDVETGNRMNKTFVCMKLDADSPFGKDMVAEYQIKGFPSYAIINYLGNEYGKKSGYMKTDALLDFVEAAEKTFTNINAYEEKIKTNPNDRFNLYRYAILLDDIGSTDKGLEIAQKFLDLGNIPETIDDNDWEIINKYCLEKDNAYLQKVISNSDKVIKNFGLEDFNTYIEKCIRYNLEIAFHETSSAHLSFVKEITNLLPDNKLRYPNEEFKHRITMHFYYFTEAWADYKKHASQLITDYAATDEDIIDIVFVLIDKIGDESSKSSAHTYAKNLVEKHPTSSNYLLLSYTSFSLGNKQEMDKCLAQATKSAETDEELERVEKYKAFYAEKNIVKD